MYKTSRSYRSFAKTIYYADLLIEEILSENLTEVKRLMEQVGADPNAVVPERGVAALHLLAGTANEDFGVAATTVALLAAGGDPNVRSEDGLTPVHVAAAWGRARVLEVLLCSGGDPSLLDYRYRDAEDYALRERQWAVFGMLAARLPSDLGLREHQAREQEWHPVQEPTDDVIDVKDDCYWLDSFSDILHLDKNAIRTISDHRRKTRVYECPTTTEEESDRTEVTVPPQRNINNLNENAISDIREHWRRRVVDERPQKLSTSESNHSQSQKVSPPPKLPKRNKSKHCRRTESEMFVCEFAEASYKAKDRGSTSRTSVGTQSVTSDLERGQNNKILCRMSRIFLFMLKKRHVYQTLR